MYEYSEVSVLYRVNNDYFNDKISYILQFFDGVWVYIYIYIQLSCLYCLAVKLVQMEMAYLQAETIPHTITIIHELMLDFYRVQKQTSEKARTSHLALSISRTISFLFWYTQAAQMLSFICILPYDFTQSRVPTSALSSIHGQQK